MARANVSTDRGTRYTIDDVVSVTFCNGQLYLIYKDEEGHIFSTGYSKESMNEGSVVIS